MLNSVAQSWCRVKLPWVLALAVASSSRAAFADGPSAQDRTTARQLAIEGYDALQARDYALAADRFKRADALVHAPTLLVDLARSYVGLGRLVEAYEVFQQVLREGVAPDAARSWQKALEAAEREAAALEPRLAWLTIRVAGAEEPHVELDGQALSEASLGTKRAVDPGRRNVLARAEGFLPVERTLELGEGQSDEVELVLEPDPNYKPPPPSEKPVLLVQAPPPSQPSRLPIYVAYGAGGAGLLLSGVSTTLMLITHDNLEGVCDPNNVCPDDYDQELSRYRTYGTLAAVGLGVGLAGAGVGTYFLLTGERKRDEETQVSVRAELAPGFLSVRGSF